MRAKIVGAEFIPNDVITVSNLFYTQISNFSLSPYSKS